MYNIVRFYKNHPLGINRSITKTGLTLKEAVQHCDLVGTSSSTTTESSALAKTDKYGDFFDGYEKSNQRLFTWVLYIDEPGKETETHINQDLDGVLPYLRQRYSEYWSDYQEDPSIYGNFIDYLYFYEVANIDLKQVWVG